MNYELKEEGEEQGEEDGMGAVLAVLNCLKRGF
jgi:hypothetical protein